MVLHTYTLQSSMQWQMCYDSHIIISTLWAIARWLTIMVCSLRCKVRRWRLVHARSLQHCNIVHCFLGVGWRVTLTLPL